MCPEKARGAAVRPGGRFLLAAERLDGLIRGLSEAGYAVIGPALGEGAIVLREVFSAEDLPRGWGEEQEAGRYRLVERKDGAWFGYVVGPHSWRRFLQPPQETLFTAELLAEGLVFRTPAPDTRRFAFLGVRPCDLAAIRIQDKVFTGGEHVDPRYQGRRERALLIAVQCGVGAPTCFCASMGSGPRAADGFDLGLTELLDGGRHEFLVEVGSEAGAAVLAGLPLAPAPEARVEAAHEVSRRVAQAQTRKLAPEAARDLLRERLESPHWEKVAERCLACSNCTMVCPTCFCNTTDDLPDLAGTASERVRRWDSCFTSEFSYIHGGSVRPSTGARYRQWIEHKLSTWYDQFGTSGCVGCGRCITWCPPAIDITAEVAALAGAAVAPAKK